MQQNLRLVVGFILAVKANSYLLPASIKLTLSQTMMGRQVRSIHISRPRSDRRLHRWNIKVSSSEHFLVFQLWTDCSSHQNIWCVYPHPPKSHLGCSGTPPRWKKQGVPSAVSSRFVATREIPHFLDVLIVVYSEILLWALVATSILRHPSRLNASKMTTNQCRLFSPTKTWKRYVCTILCLDHCSHIDSYTPFSCMQIFPF